MHRFWANGANFTNSVPSQPIHQYRVQRYTPSAYFEIEHANSNSNRMKNRKKTRKYKPDQHPNDMICELLFELYDTEKRESALRRFSGIVQAKCDDDPEFYSNSAKFMYQSVGIISILIQEIISIYPKLEEESLSLRTTKRLLNVLILFQCLASSKESQEFLLKASIPSYLIPLLFAKNFPENEAYLEVRCTVLLVIKDTFKADEKMVMEFAIENKILDLFLRLIGRKDLKMKVNLICILELLVKNKYWKVLLGSLKEPKHFQTFMNLISSLRDLVLELENDSTASFKLLGHVIVCFKLFCQLPETLDLVLKNIPFSLFDDTFKAQYEELPLLNQLRSSLNSELKKVHHRIPLSTLDGNCNSNSKKSNETMKANCLSSYEG